MRIALAVLLAALLAGYISTQGRAENRLGFTPVQTTILPGINRDVDPEPGIAALPEPTPTPDADPIIEAIRAQLPTTVPVREEMGWPMHLLAGAITWARIGETELATAWADEFWNQRDPESGLWINNMGYVDMANPWLATRLYMLVGQPERAAEVSALVIQWSRDHEWGGYNPHFFAGLTAVVIGNEFPADIAAKVAPGYDGEYAPGEGVTPKGRYYSDIMRSYWNAYGLGDQLPLLADETEYCPTLQGAAECVSFYRWAEGVPVAPDLAGEPYSFYTDGMFLYALAGLEE